MFKTNEQKKKNMQSQWSNIKHAVIQITVHRGDDCTLLNNSQPYKWKVKNPKGGEATMPSICFVVPPTNKEAVDSVNE